MPSMPELNIVPDIMAEISLPCTFAGCGYKTGELARVVAASVLSSHTTGNHSCPAPPVATAMTDYRNWTGQY